MRAISRCRRRNSRCPPTGFAEMSYSTAYESPTGDYTINVYLVSNGKRSTLLGSTTVNVKEFLPDRMKIETRLSKTSAHGWVDPKEMRASIALANLYGTPASDRRIKSQRRAFARAVSRFANSGTTASTIRCATRRRAAARNGRSRRAERRTPRARAELRSATRTIRRRDLRDAVLRRRL